MMDEIIDSNTLTRSNATPPRVGDISIIDTIRAARYLTAMGMMHGTGEWFVAPISLLPPEPDAPTPTPTS